MKQNISSLLLTHEILRQVSVDLHIPLIRNDVESFSGFPFVWYRSFIRVLGLVVEGIWEPATDITDVNATHLTKDKRTLATADDFGFVKLFDFPVKVK